MSQKDARMQKKTDGDSSSKGVIKSATLPRTNVKDLVKQGSGVDSQRDDASTSSGASRIRTRPHGDSRTLPLNLPSDKKSDLNVVKGHAAALHGHISKSMNVVIENRSSATAGTVRPKSWPAKEKPNAATSTSRNKEKASPSPPPHRRRLRVTLFGTQRDHDPLILLIDSF